MGPIWIDSATRRVDLTQTDIGRTRLRQATRYETGACHSSTMQSLYIAAGIVASAISAIEFRLGIELGIELGSEPGFRPN